MIRKLTRIHPASVIAMLALFLALSGISYAAVGGKIGTSEIKNGAVTKVKIKKEAVTGPKIKNDAVTGAKIKDEAVTGAKVNEATLGTVPDAAKLGGKEPVMFESKGFGGADLSFQAIKKSATTTIAQQSLPAGTYLVMARGGVNNNGTEEIDAGAVNCTLTAGGVTREVGFGALAKNTLPGDREEFDLMLLAALPSPGDAVLACEANATWKSGNVTDPTIVAVSLQS
jgi:hypothetical protein